MNYFEFERMLDGEPTAMTRAALRSQRLDTETVLRRRYGLNPGTPADELKRQIALHWRGFTDVIFVEDDIDRGLKTAELLTRVDCKVLWMQQFYGLNDHGAEALVVTNLSDPANYHAKRMVHWNSMQGQLALIGAYSEADLPNTICVSGRKLTKILTKEKIHCIAHSGSAIENDCMTNHGALGSVVLPLVGTAYRDTFEEIELVISKIYEMSRPR